jgi:hypothetical protein
MAKPVMLPVAALPVHAKCPSGVTATQQAAPCGVGTDALTSCGAPSAPTRKEETVLSVASVTNGVAAWVEGEAERSGAVRRRDHRIAGQPSAQRERLQLVCRLLGDHERGSVRRDRHLGGAGGGRRQRLAAAEARRQPPSRLSSKAATFGTPPELST